MCAFYYMFYYMFLHVICTIPQIKGTLLHSCRCNLQPYLSRFSTFLYKVRGPSCYIYIWHMIKWREEKTHFKAFYKQDSKPLKYMVAPLKRKRCLCGIFPYEQTVLISASICNTKMIFSLSLYWKGLKWNWVGK